jgi:sugar lactone lactonase YvrE
MRRLFVGSALACVALTACNECPDQSGIACIYAGTGERGLDPDGLAPEQTEIYFAMDMEFAPDGTPYFIDWNNHRIRRVVDGVVETVVGSEITGDGPAEGNDFTPPGIEGTTCRLNHPTDMQFDAEGHLIIAAWHNHKIRNWDPSTHLEYTAAGRGAGFAGDASQFAQALFNQPSTIVRTSDGRMFILDQRNQRIRLVSADGTINTIVGNGTAGYAGDGGPPAMAQVRFEAGPNPEPSGGLAYDEGNNLLYIADGLNHRIRRVDFANDRIETVVGTGEAGYSGDDGPGTAAQINNPKNIEMGPDGRVYFADTNNNRIRVWDPTSNIVETFAGTGEAAMGEVGRQATDVALSRPFGIAFGPDGALYVADTFNSRYLRIPL